MEIRTELKVVAYLEEIKVCCDNGKPISEMSDLDKLACNHDNCIGPIEVEDYKNYYSEWDDVIAPITYSKEELEPIYKCIKPVKESK